MLKAISAKVDECPLCQNEIKKGEYCIRSSFRSHHVKCVEFLCKAGSVKDPKNLKAVADEKEEAKLLAIEKRFEKIQNHILNGGDLLDV